MDHEGKALGALESVGVDHPGLELQLADDGQAAVAGDLAGLLAQPTKAPRRGDTAFEVFDEITPDAPILLVEMGIQRFMQAQCDAIVAVGGGPVLDAAKATGLAAANHKQPRELVGCSLGRHAPPPLYAVPTTTGMDALTRAVEAYLSQGALPLTDQMALAATGAGLAFTRANVGNVHAIAHPLGARHHAPPAARPIRPTRCPG